MLEGRERVLLCDAGRMVEVGSDLHEVLIERGLHPGHLRLEVRDLLLLRFQVARKACSRGVFIVRGVLSDVL